MVQDQNLDEKAIFNAALALESSCARQEYLKSACDGDRELLQRVTELLELHAESPSFLDAPAAGIAATLAMIPPTERVGKTIGRYKLRELLGEGGMGSVYVAEQTEPVRRKVALKIIKPGMDSREVISRFEAEQQALALMDHPNIARVLDAGTTDNGLPYFVMELVKGVPITEHCDLHRLGVRERFELFLQVCHAVQHAHQKGIIHRDLKPSNVIVAVHDGEPVVKVIDFGVAKAIGQQLGGSTIYTAIGQMVGTPLYMSPEQSGQNSFDIDTRSDIYSLGVLLYELLTGNTPFDRETLKQACFDEIRRMIRDVDPQRPSDRLSTLNAIQLSTIADRRQMDPRVLRQQVRGELDWIVMKALEKDRNRRYESACAFAADVQHYLNDEPVEACPPTVSYRLRKFAHRNRQLLITAGTLAAVLVATTLLSVWQAVQSRLAERRAETAQTQAEADRAQAQEDRERARLAERKAASEASIARSVNEFLQVDLLRLADPSQQLQARSNPDLNLTVKQAVDRAAAKVGTRFEDQPLVEAAIQETVGNAYRGVGEYQLAVGHLERAVALRREHLGLSHRDTLGSVESLAAGYIDAKRLPEAIALHAEALELFKATFGPDGPNTYNLIWSYARANRAAGKLDEAERLLRLNIETQRKNNSTTRLSISYSIGWLCRILLEQKKYSAAEPFAREILSIYESEVPDLWHRFVAMSLLGGSLLGQQKYSEAEPLLLQAYDELRAWEPMLGADWNWRVSEAGHRIVDFYEATNQPEKARAWQEKLGYTLSKSESDLQPLQSN